MRLHICAVGRLRAGPARDLVDDYTQRIDRSGRPLGIGPVSEHEIEDKKGGGMMAEAEMLGRILPVGAMIVAMDERGSVISSPEFATQLAKWRDDGRQDVAFIIGGADGIAPVLRDRADFSISFGKMVWPHLLVRVMLAEQLYRATTILGGGPYHRA